MKARHLFLVACAIALTCGTALGDTFTFNDLGGQMTVTVTSTNSSRFSIDCRLDSCSLLLLAPSSGAVPFAPASLFINIPEPGGRVQVSDVFDIFTIPNPTNFLVNGSVGIRFFSSSEGPCVVNSNGETFNICGFPETGAVQGLPGVTWSDGTIDTIQFQSSEAAETPELGSLLLLATGISGLGILRKRIGRPASVRPS